MEKGVKNSFFWLQRFFIPCRENRYRPKFLESRFLIFCLASLLLMKIISIAFFIYLPRNLFFADLSGLTLLKLTNENRQAAGLNPLKENALLNLAAYFKAEDMLSKDYFSHYSPQGKSPWFWFKTADYNYQFAGENLAIGFLDANEVYQAWEKSPSHLANLLNNHYQDIGIAVLRGNFQGNETFIVVQLFGAPQASQAKTLAQETIVKEQTPLSIEVAPKAPEVPEEPKAPDIPKVSNSSITPEPPQLVFQPGVASAATSIRPSLKALPPENPKDAFSLKLLGFLSQDFPDFVRKITFSFLLIISFALVLTVFVRIDIQHPDLIFKTLFFIGLLIIFTSLNEQVLLNLIPHSFEII